MGRTVITRKDVASAVAAAAAAPSLDAAESAHHAARAAAAQSDGYLDRLLKYIPGEVVAFYLGVEGALRTLQPAASPGGAAQWTLFLLTLAATPFWLRRVAKVAKWKQVALSTAAFAVWVFALPGPFATFGWYQPALGTIAILGYTFIVPIVGVEALPSEAPIDVR